MNLGGDHRSRFLPEPESPACPLVEMLGMAEAVMEEEIPDGEPEDDERCGAVRNLFEDTVGPLGATQDRRLELLVMRYGEAAVLRALAEVIILELNNMVLGRVRDRLLARYQPL